MPCSIRIDPETGVAFATCTGVLQLADAHKCAAKLWADPAWPGRAAVWDFRSASFDMSSSDVIELSLFVRENQRDPPAERLAFVAQVSTDFGMARMFEAYRRDSRTLFRVFRDYAEARSWADTSGPGTQPDD